MEGSRSNAAASSSGSTNTLERLCQRLSTNDPTLSLVRLDGSQLDRLLQLLAPQPYHGDSHDNDNVGGQNNNAKTKAEDEDRVAALAFASALTQNKNSHATILELECGRSNLSSSSLSTEHKNGPSKQQQGGVLGQMLSRFVEIRLIGSGIDDERATILSRSNSTASLQSLSTSPDANNGGRLYRVPSSLALLEDEMEEYSIDAGAVIVLTHLARSTKLRRLSLSHLRVTRSLARALQQLLSLTSTLTDLELLSCSIVETTTMTNQGASSLASLLVPSIPTPKTGSDRTAHVLTTALAWNATVQTVTLELGSGSLVLLAALEGLMQRFTPPTSASTTSIRGIMNNNNPSPASRSGNKLKRLFLKQSHRPILLPDAAQRLVDVLTIVPIGELKWQGGTNLQHFLEALSHNATGVLTKLQLTDCDMTQQDINTLASYLKLGSKNATGLMTDPSNHPAAACRLRELVLQEIPLGVSGFATLVQAMQHNQSVRVLDVCDVQLHGTQAAVWLRELLSSTHSPLQVLKLGEVELDHPVHDSQVLADGFANNRTLHELDVFLCRNWDWIILAPSLVRIRTLRLPLCCNDIGPHQLSQVLSALYTQSPNPAAMPTGANDSLPQPPPSSSPHDLALSKKASPLPSVATIGVTIIGLIELDLSHNRFGNAEAVVLSVFVRHSHQLQQLQLDQNHIGDEGASMLFRAMMQHPTLHQLTLAGNKLGETSIRVLAEALPTVPLRHLSFWWKEEAMDKTLPFLMKGLAHNASLLSLDVENGQGRIALPQLEFYLFRNMIQPWMQDDRPPQSGTPLTLWPCKLSWLSSKQASLTYYVLREKLPNWLMR